MCICHSDRRVAADHACLPPELTPEPVEHNAKRCKFTRLDTPWRDRLFAELDGWLRLAVVLLEEADFHRRIEVGTPIMAAAGLPRQRKRECLERLERLGLIAIEWQGQGMPIITPLHLSGRPRRR
jgi:hypothetical protein